MQVHHAKPDDVNCKGASLAGAFGFINTSKKPTLTLGEGVFDIMFRRYLPWEMCQSSGLETLKTTFRERLTLRRGAQCAVLVGKQRPATNWGVDATKLATLETRCCSTRSNMFVAS